MLLSVVGAVALLLVVALEIAKSRLEEFRSTTDSDGQSIWSEDYSSEKQRSIVDRAMGVPARARSIGIIGNDKNFDVQLRALGKLSQLEDLSVSSVDIVDFEGFPSVPLVNLRRLRFANCSSEIVKRLLDRAPNLVELTIYECKPVADDDLTSLIGMRKLVSISVDGSSVSGSLFRGLTKCDNLVSVKVRWSPCCTTNDICFLGFVESLRTVSLKGEGQYLELRQLTCLRNLASLDLDGFVINEQSEKSLRESLKAKIDTRGCEQQAVP